MRHDIGFSSLINFLIIKIGLIFKKIDCFWAYEVSVVFVKKSAIEKMFLSDSLDISDISLTVFASLTSSRLVISLEISLFEIYSTISIFSSHEITENSSFLLVVLFVRYKKPVFLLRPAKLLSNITSCHIYTTCHSGSLMRY